jgi:hypothetical protein
MQIGFPQIPLHSVTPMKAYSPCGSSASAQPPEFSKVRFLTLGRRITSAPSFAENLSVIAIDFKLSHRRAD